MKLISDLTDEINQLTSEEPTENGHLNEIKLTEFKIEEARVNEEPDRDEESISNLKEEFNIQH